MSQLIPCPSCARHVRANDTTCPFCAAALALAPVAAPVLGERLGRAALFAFGAAMATNVAACSMSSTPPTDTGTASPDTGSAPADAGVDAAGNPDSGFFPPYGTPPPEDAGPDMGGLSGAYGAPPPLDGGP